MENIPSGVWSLIFVECDILSLIKLMSSCKFFRNCVGKSDIWKLCLINDSADSEIGQMIESCINIEQIISLFVKSKFCSIQKKDYYGNYYYIYFISNWIIDDNFTLWNLSYILNNIKEIKKMEYICNFLGMTVHAMDYHYWFQIFSRVNFGEADQNHLNNILSKLYISRNSYGSGSYEDSIIKIYFSKKGENSLCVTESEVVFVYNCGNGYHEVNKFTDGLLRYGMCENKMQFYNAIGEYAIKSNLDSQLLQKIIIFMTDLIVRYPRSIDFNKIDISEKIDDVD